MTDHTDEELIALAKKCGIQELYNAYEAPGYFSDKSELRAFAQALRQQDLARMARIREELTRINGGLENCIESAKLNHDDYAVGYMGAMLQVGQEALSETSDIQEWMDGQRADERELCAKICDEREKHLLSLAKIQATGEDRNSYLSDCFIVRSLSEAIRARSTKGEG